jgi:SAM-dependent methyltransferase
MRWDPLYETLHQHLPKSGVVLDAGCGYGLTSVWLACLYPRLNFIAFDPHPHRLKVARYVLDGRASVFESHCEDWSSHRKHHRGESEVHAAMCIDVLHHLHEPTSFLRSLAETMVSDGVLLLRTTVREGGERRSHWVERWMVRLRGQKTIRFYEELEVKRLLFESGFRLVHVEGKEGTAETLFVARRAETCGNPR